MKIFENTVEDWKFYLSVWLVLFFFPGSLFAVASWEMGLPANFWQSPIEQHYTTSSEGNYRCEYLKVSDIDYVSGRYKSSGQTVVTSDKGIYTVDGYWSIGNGVYVVSPYNNIVAKLTACPAAEDLQSRPTPLLMVVVSAITLPTVFCLFVAIISSSD